MRKNAKKYITLKCSKCEREFNKELKEHSRQTKKGRVNFYCGKECCNAGVKQILRDKNAGNLNFYFQEVKKSARSRNREFNLNLLDLNKQWEEKNLLQN